MRPISLVLVVGCLAFAPAPLPRREKSDLESMQGEWVLHAMIDNGREASATQLRAEGMNLSVVIEGRRWIQRLRLPSASNDEERSEMTIKFVDQSKSPKQFVLKQVLDDAICIYRLDRDLLTVRYGGRVAPKDFNSSPTSKEGEREILVFRRKKR